MLRTSTKYFITLKKSGHQRISPQVSPEKISKMNCMLICDQCGSELESQGLLVAHVKKHVTTCYSCEDCNHEFISKADFGSHLKNVHASTRCTSEVCDDKFISKEDLKEHIEKVHARKVFACEYCEQIFTMERNLGIHVEHVHGKDSHSVEWNCNDCPYQGSEASDLLNHLK